MIQLGRSTDRRLIRSIVGREDVREELGEETLAVPMHESIYYLVPSVAEFSDGAVADVAMGALAFVPLNSVTWNPHIVILPEYRGCGTEVMREGIRWMFEHTPCRKVSAFPPVFNRRMIRVFQKCGLRVEGLSPKSYLFDGALHDRLIMGIEKECH